MKFIIDPKNIHGVLSPAFCLFKVIGLAPFSYQKSGGFKTTCWDMFYLILLSVLHVSVNLYLIKSHTDFDQLGMSVITTMAWQIIYHYGVFSKVICILQSFLTRKDSMKFIKSIEMFDKKVIKLGSITLF
jgi:hypothetical protein